MTGLTSVTFRHLSPSEIIRLAQKANMDGIESVSYTHLDTLVGNSHFSQSTPF